MRRLGAIAAAAALALVLTGSSGAGPAGGGAGRLTPPGRVVEFSLVLRQRDRAADRYLRGLFDPGSPSYGRYLAPAAYGRRFGLSGAALRNLAQRLRANGLRVTESYPQRTGLRLRGTAAAVRRVFGASLREGVTAEGIPYHEPETPPAVPPDMARWVVAVDGLDTRPVARPAVLPNNELEPADVRDSYQIQPLHSAKNDGRNQTIAVLSIDRYSQRNVDAFDKRYGLPAARIKPVTVSKAQLDFTSESDMDIEIVHGVAPGAQVIDYQLAFDDLAEAINRVVKDGKAKIVTGSFGTCDSTGADRKYGDDASWLIQNPAFRRGVESALRAAAAAGVSFFFSSGDAGAYRCQRDSLDDLNLTVEFPSDAPYAIAVGGTVLSYEQGKWYEDAWPESGGGLNPFDARPLWQKSTDAVAGGASAKRRVPDVAAAAQDWSVLTTDEDPESGKKTTHWSSSGGTSASTPFWAASMLLVQQYMKSRGAGQLCFAAPLLYGIAAEAWKNAPFYDITSGKNGYDAAGGWDFVTGLGSPYLANLAGAAVIYRRAHPLKGSCT